MRLSMLIITLIFFFTLSRTNVLAVENPTAMSNNRFGIHILFPGELEMAAKLVNSNGGDWGYVTIPIQSTDRNLEKWQKFMDGCRHFHIIPIIRIATFPKGNFWTRPTIFDHLDFANFLNSLLWPTKNRYIIVYNEPNSNLEWGGAVDASHYSQELSHTIDAFKRVSEDFFIISAGLDSQAPNRGELYQSSYNFLLEMDKAVPGIFSRVDGFASHSYPGKNFTSNPQGETRGGVLAYRDENTFLVTQFGRSNIPIFITETGWEHSAITEDQAASFYAYAFGQIWNDTNIVAVTPFLLNGQASNFSGFSMLRADGNPTKMFETIATLPKTQGRPTVVTEIANKKTIIAPRQSENFQDTNAALPIISVSQPLRVFLKWLLY